MKPNNLLIIVIIYFFLFSHAYLRVSSANNFLKIKKIADRDSEKYKHTTRLLDGKKGSVYSLTLHNVDCVDYLGPITGFHLWGSWGVFSNDLALEYSCMDYLIKSRNLQKSTFESQNTKNTKKLKDSPKALIDIDADCKENFLGKFQLQNDDKNKKLYFSGECIKLKQKQGTCETITGGKGTKSSWFLGMGSTLSNLDKIPVNAPENKALVSFKMIKTKDDKIAFEYVACEIDMTDDTKEDKKNDKPIPIIHDERPNTPAPIINQVNNKIKKNSGKKNVDIINDIYLRK